MIIVTTRHHDFANTYEVFAEGQPEPTIVNLDYGGMDLNDPEEFNDWAATHAAEANKLHRLGTPNALEAAKYILDAISEARSEYQS